MGTLLALAAAFQITLLPPHAPGVPPEVVKAAAQALQRSLPAPWGEARLDAAAFAEHLAAAGPACRFDLTCLCSVAPFDEGALALDLRLSTLSPNLRFKGQSADLRLVEPCSGRVLDRRAAALEAGPAAAARFISEAAVALLRGRDLPAIRWPGKAGVTAPGEPPVRRPVAPLPR